EANWRSVLQSEQFKVQASLDRFEAVHSALKDRPAKGQLSQQQPWVPADRAVSVATKQGDKALTMTFKLADGKSFGEWISGNLGSLYEAFRKSKDQQNGD